MQGKASSNGPAACNSLDNSNVVSKMQCKSVLACWRQPMSKRPGFSARKECCTMTACYLRLQLMQDGWAPIFKILTLRRWPVLLCHKKCGTCGWCDTNTQKENGKVSYWDKAHSHWDAQGLQVTSSPCLNRHSPCRWPQRWKPQPPSWQQRDAQTKLPLTASPEAKVQPSPAASVSRKPG